MAINLIQALSQSSRPMLQQQGPQNAGLAKALTQSAYSNDPIETPIEGLGRFAAAWQGNRINEKNKQAEMQQHQELINALAGGADPMTAIAASGNTDLIKTGAEYSLANALTRSKVGENPTSGMKEYQLAQQQGFDGSFLDYKTGLAKSGASNISFNNEQSKAAGFADRAMAAEQVLLKLDEQGTQTGARVLDAVPFGLGNHMQSTEYQQFDQARRDFVNATLRRESGAVISEQEFANAEKQYFPQPGDSPQVMQQKRNNRRLVIEGMVRAAGGSYSAPQQQQPADLSGMSDADLEAIINGGQ